MKPQLAVQAVLPASAVVCFFCYSHMSLMSFLALATALPAALTAAAAANPEVTLALLLPFFAIFQCLSLFFGKLKSIVRPPDLAFVPKGKVKKVAVIGGGSSGIAAAKEAMEAGLEVVVFEQTDQIGGNWVFRETDAHSSVYRSTVINTTKQAMSFSDYPMTEETPAYPHHSHITEYFKSYAEHFDVTPKIRFHTRVLDVSQIAGDRWKVVSCPTDSADVGRPEESHGKVREDDEESPLQDSGSHTVEEYDAVMVCNGHHHIPTWPSFPGQDKFKGHMIHSHSYKDPTSCDSGFDYRDKRVLVVGVGNSGCDVAVELSRVTEQLYLATRSGLWVLPKYVQGVALDHEFNLKRLIAICIPRAFEETSFYQSIFADVFEHKVQAVQGNMAKWGMRPQYRISQQHPTVNQDILHRIGVGSITMQGNVREITEDGVVFDDGERVKLDAIIFATGYKIRFPFLTKSLAPVNEENHVRLHHFMLNPKHPPTMVFIGLIQPIGPLMPIAELQCRWAMQIFKGERGVLRPAELERLITARLDTVWKTFLRRARHTTESHYFPIVEALAEEIGCVPRLWNPANWKVMKELLLSPAGWPFTYRLQGPGQKVDTAVDALKTAFSQIGKHP